jgi:hypothetical protein
MYQWCTSIATTGHLLRLAASNIPQKCRLSLITRLAWQSLIGSDESALPKHFSSKEITMSGSTNAGVMVTVGLVCITASIASADLRYSAIYSFGGSLIDAGRTRYHILIEEDFRPSSTDTTPNLQ